MLELIDYTNILDTAKKRGKNQLLLTRFLREHRFHFIPNHLLEQKGLKLRDKDQPYNFMVIKTQNFTSTFLAFGFKLNGKKTSKVKVYFNHTYLETLQVELGHSHKNFKKVKITVTMPKKLNYAERKEWRSEHDKLTRNPKLTPSKFYLKWLPKVTIKK